MNFRLGCAFFSALNTTIALACAGFLLRIYEMLPWFVLPAAAILPLVSAGSAVFFLYHAIKGK